MTLCFMVNKNLSSKAISFSKVIPWSFVQLSFIGDWFVNFLFPETDQIESAFGISIFLSVVIKPLSITYPSLELRGARNFTF